MAKKKLKKKQRNNKKWKKDLKRKTVKMKGTIDKKQLKKLDKILSKTTQIPELESVRKECNHHYKSENALMTVADFKQTDKAQFVPELDKYIEVFGEENVSVCRLCLTPVVNPACVSPDDLKRCSLLVSGAIEIIKMNKKLDKKELKLFNDAKKGITSDLKEIGKRYVKVYDKLADGETSKAAINKTAGKGYSQVE